MSQPQISFEVCQASTRVKEATLADLIHINKVITKVQRERSYLHFPKLNLSSLHVRVKTDVSFNNLPDGGSQEDHLVLLADASNSCCPIAWTSNKAKCIVRLTLAAETLVLNDGSDSAFYIAQLFCSIFPAGTQKPKILALTNNQSAIDAIHSTSSVADWRLRVEIGALRQYQAESKIAYHYIQGALQLSDSLTSNVVHQMLFCCKSSKVTSFLLTKRL